GDDAQGQLGADAVGAGDGRLVVGRHRLGQFGRRQHVQHRQGRLGPDPLDAQQGGEGAPVVAGGEAVQPRTLLGRPAGLDVQGGLVAGRRQAAQGARAAGHHIADAGRVDQALGLADLGQHPAQTADHAAPRAASWLKRRRWAWAMATARASAASALTSPAAGRSRLTMKAIWLLSAWPAPTTAFLIALGEYSATGRPARAGASMTAARAWPSRRVEAGFMLTNTSSTAASWQPWAAQTSPRASSRCSRRSANGRVSRGATTPWATHDRRAPSQAITPQPVRRRPGSSPRTRIALFVIRSCMPATGLANNDRRQSSRGVISNRATRGEAARAAAKASMFSRLKPRTFSSWVTTPCSAEAQPMRRRARPWPPSRSRTSASDRAWPGT